MFLRLSVWPRVAGLCVLLSACATERVADCPPCAQVPPVTQSTPVPVPAPAPAPVAPKPQAVTPPSAPVASPAVAPGRLVAARWADLPGWNADAMEAAWPAWQRSCRVLRKDAAWAGVCAQADALGDAPARAVVRQFFDRNFRPWQVRNADNSTGGLVTGYYEPLIRGSLERSAQNAWPIHGVPQDMVSVELASVYPELKPMRLRGRIEGNRLVPYWTRREVTAQGDAFPAPVLAWADDPIALFFLQVQGSGRVELPDGSYLRIGYADQNGHPYKSIGKWLVEQGALKLSEASMQGIQRWARANPARLRELLDQNPSYVFFRTLPDNNDGPIGALGVPLVAERSIAVDRQTVPLGAPVFLDTTRPNTNQPLRHLVMAQDTGSAIRGGVRADFFWGFGDAAGAEAGRMKQNGAMWVLLPKGLAPR
ncbi:murein transglycosylase [Denitromonas ohlonensis]|uniref:peptidoglycan lytic exotransglycosylase n=2 Tax=Denitromonas TaxID=139331 RepID=A0A557RYZ6_9RHOO|nr:murein transglycosylase [Denitromonas ohlonensis]TVO70382.1 murein transglycosylase [Denitromonas ohlonensis]